MANTSVRWVEVGKAEGLTPGFHLIGEGRSRFILALIDGELFAFSPICPHAGGNLQFAETEGKTITCPLHGWRFDLAQGGKECHGYRDVCTYEVRVERGLVFVAIPEPARAKV